MDASLINLPSVVKRLKAALASKDVSVGSICSGWGVGEMVVDSLNEFLQRDGEAFADH